MAVDVMRRRVSVMNSRLPYSSTGRGRLLALRHAGAGRFVSNDGMEEKQRRTMAMPSAVLWIEERDGRRLAERSTPSSNLLL